MPKLVENKIQRREQRLRAARKANNEKKHRSTEVILSQLALIQELATRQEVMPVPHQLLASFGRRPLPDAFAATG